MEDITPQIYSQAIKYYKDRNKSFRENIDRDVRNSVTDGLFNGEVVFLDTLMTAHPASAVCVLSDAVKRAFRIDLWSFREDLITEEESLSRLGMDLKTQISVHGQRSYINPFQKSVPWKLITPVTEKDELDHEDINKPHLALTCSWSGCKDHILDHLLERIKEIYDFNQSIPRFMALRHTQHMHLDELVCFLHQHGGNSVIQEFFDYYLYRVVKPTENQSKSPCLLNLSTSSHIFCF